MAVFKCVRLIYLLVTGDCAEEKTLGNTDCNNVANIKQKFINRLYKKNVKCEL